VDAESRLAYFSVETIWTATLATLQTTGEKEQPTTLSEALNKAGSDELEQLATDIQTAVHAAS